MKVLAIISIFIVMLRLLFDIYGMKSESDINHTKGIKIYILLFVLNTISLFTAIGLLNLTR